MGNTSGISNSGKKIRYTLIFTTKFKQTQKINNSNK